MKTMTLTEARNQLLKVAEEMERRPDQVIEIVKRGKKVMTLLSADVYEAIVIGKGPLQSSGILPDCGGESPSAGEDRHEYSGSGTLERGA